MQGTQNGKKNTPFSTNGRGNCLVVNELQTNAGLELLPQSEAPQKKWFAMRDLKRSNAKLPAYKQLQEEGITIFTPMHWRLRTKGNRQVREKVPFIQDLIFVHESRERLDPIVRKTPTLQYRYLKGRPYCEPMSVPDKEMELFMHAVSDESVGTPRYYLPEELSPEMCNRRVRIVGGHLDGYEGRLLTMRGSRVKRLLVELPTWLTAAVEVSPEYIQLL